MSASISAKKLLATLLKRQQTLTNKVAVMQKEREKQQQEIRDLKRKQDEDRAAEESRQAKRSKAETSTSKMSTKIPQPPSFEGNNKLNVGVWLFELQQYFDLAQIRGRERVAWAGTLLREGAATWWNSVVLEKKRRSPTVDSSPSASSALGDSTSTKDQQTTTTALLYTSSLAAAAIAIGTLPSRQCT